MADVTTSAQDNGDLTTWAIPKADTPPIFGEGAIPRGEMVYRGSLAIPAKLAADESRCSIQLNLPTNFAYKLADISFAAQGSDSADFTDFEPAVRGLITADQGGVSSVQSLFVPLYSDMQYATTNARMSFQLHFTSNAVDRMVTFSPAYVPGTIIRAETGGRMSLTWMDVSTDASNEVTAHWYARFLQFDLTQLNSFPIHVATPIIGA